MTEVQGGPRKGAVAGQLSGPFKLAAPVAAAALGVVIAIAGGSLLASNTRTEVAALPPGEANIAASEPASALLVDPAASLPDAAPAAPQPGGAIPGPAFDQTPGLGAQASMEIVVKFKDDAKVKDIIEAFWKDRPNAAAKFERFKAGRAELAHLKLERVTYSNELVLVHDGSAPVGERLTAMRAAAARLKSLADISYAEPNMVAHPGGQ